MTNLILNNIDTAEIKGLKPTRVMVDYFVLYTVLIEFNSILMKRTNFPVFQLASLMEPTFKKR